MRNSKTSRLRYGNLITFLGVGPSPCITKGRVSQNFIIKLEQYPLILFTYFYWIRVQFNPPRQNFTFLCQSNLLDMMNMQIFTRENAFNARYSASNFQNRNYNYTHNSVYFRPKLTIYIYHSTEFDNTHRLVYKIRHFDRKFDKI